MLGTYVLLNIREAMLFSDPRTMSMIPGSTPEMIRFQAAAERSLYGDHLSDLDIEYQDPPAQHTDMGQRDSSDVVGFIFIFEDFQNFTFLNSHLPRNQ
jgi:hypothetical protein